MPGYQDQYMNAASERNRRALAWNVLELQRLKRLGLPNIRRYDLERHVSRSDLLSGRAQTFASLPSLSPRRVLAVDGFSVAPVPRGYAYTSDAGSSVATGGRRVVTFSDTASSIGLGDAATQAANAGPQNSSLFLKEPTLVMMPVPVKDYSNSFPSPRPVPVKELVVNGLQSGGLQRPRVSRMRSVVLNAPVNNCSGVTLGGRPLQPPVVLPDGGSSLSLYPSEVNGVKSGEKDTASTTGKPFEALISPTAAGGESDERWYKNRSHADESERNALAPFLTNEAPTCGWRFMSNEVDIDHRKLRNDVGSADVESWRTRKAPALAVRRARVQQQAGVVATPARA